MTRKNVKVSLRQVRNYDTPTQRNISDLRTQISVYPNVLFKLQGHSTHVQFKKAHKQIQILYREQKSNGLSYSFF